MHLPIPLLRAGLAFVLALSVLPFSALAQTTAAGSATGVIQGRVFNPVAAEYVRNAEVKLEGTNQVTYTENDGSFVFRGVAPGSATIAITYVGYQPMRETLTVSAGQIATREINLASTSAAPAAGKDGVLQLSAFTVSTEREGNAKAIMEQRRNMDIVTSVSSDIFGDVTDGNVGEFLKYLPGVDLDYVNSEARGPRLGGMEGQYVGVSFDGIRTASADANRGGDDASRATSFEGFSITSIESVEINRTRSPDSDADSPAGSINMKTRRAFDRKGRRYSFNASANFNNEEFHLKKTWGPDDNQNYKWKPNLSLEYSESFFNQRFGILLSASRANSYTEQYVWTHTYSRAATAADPRPLVARQIDFADGPKFILKDALMLTADFKATRNLVLSFNAIYTYTEGDFYNRNFTFVAANDNANVNNGRPSIGGDGLLTLRTNRNATSNVATMNNGGGSSTKLTYTRTFAPKFEYKRNAWTLDGALAFSKSVNNYEAIERGFSELESLNLASGWTATRPHPESWEWAIRQTSGPDWFNLANWAGGTRVENSAREWITEIWSAQLNARYVLPFLKRFATAVKFGGKWNEESRDNNNLDEMNVWRYVGEGGDTFTGYNAITGAPAFTTNGNWANLGYVSPHAWDSGTNNALTLFNIDGTQGMAPRADRTKIGTLFRNSPQLFVSTTTPDNFYNSAIAAKRDFRQTVTSAYSQGDIRLTSKLRILGGVRWEQTENELTEWDPRQRDEVVAAGFPVNANGRATSFDGLRYQFQSKPRVKRDSKYHNYFPSVSGKYYLLQDLELQAGFSKAISRPPINALTGLWTIVEDASGATQRVDAPNPSLLPEHIKKYDARLAYYFGARGARSPGQLSLAVSQFDIRNLRETFDYSAAEFGVDDPEYASFTFRSTRNSERRRRQRNLEFSYNQTLGFLPDAFRGTSVNVAYTRSYASARRNGLAPHRLSSRLGYSYRRFNGSIGMVWIDDRPDGIYGRYRPEMTTFDLALNWKFTNRYSAYIQVRNLTNQPFKWNESPPGVVEGQMPALRLLQDHGSNYVFGIKGVF